MGYHQAGKLYLTQRRPVGRFINSDKPFFVEVWYWTTLFYRDTDWKVVPNSKPLLAMLFEIKFKKTVAVENVGWFNFTGRPERMSHTRLTSKHETDRETGSFLIEQKLNLVKFSKKN